MIYNKKWTLKYKGEVKETNLSKKINISPEISQILNNRGIENEKDAIQNIKDHLNKYWAPDYKYEIISVELIKENAVILSYDDITIKAV